MNSQNRCGRTLTTGRRLTAPIVVRCSLAVVAALLASAVGIAQPVAHAATTAPVHHQVPGYHQVPEIHPHSSGIRANAISASYGSGSGFCASNSVPGTAARNLYGSGSGASGYAQFGNVYACGPALGRDWNSDQFEGDFQCTELSSRFMWAVYGDLVTNVGAGKDFVDIAHSQFPAFDIGTGAPGSYPLPGDIVSMHGGPSADVWGHTAVVTDISGLDTHTGNGFVTLMEQNGASTGWNQLDVNNWTYSFGNPNYSAFYYYDTVSWLKVAPRSAAYLTTVFAGTDHQLSTTVHDNHSWNDPQPIGSPGGTGVTSDPGATTMTPNTLDVFARGSDSDVWYRYWSGSAWSVWVPLGTPPSPGGKGSGGVSAVSMKTGTIDVVTTDAAGQVWYDYWSGSAWSGWVAEGSPPNGIVDRPATISVTPDTMDMWTVGATDHHVWFKYWGGHYWSQWIDEGGNLASGVSAASMGPGSQDVFGRAPDGALVYIYTPTGNWFTDWVKVPGTFTGQPSAASQALGRVDVFATQVNGTASNLAVMHWNGGSWSDWMTPAPWTVPVLPGSSPAAAAWTCILAPCATQPGT